MMRYFLVYGECECGWKCACLEGSFWPKCPACGEQVLPPLDGTPRFAFDATLMPEQEALTAIRRGKPLAEVSADMERERRSVYA